MSVWRFWGFHLHYVQRNTYNTVPSVWDRYRVKPPLVDKRPGSHTGQLWFLCEFAFKRWTRLFVFGSNFNIHRLSTTKYTSVARTFSYLTEVQPKSLRDALWLWRETDWRRKHIPAASTDCDDTLLQFGTPNWIQPSKSHLTYMHSLAVQWFNWLEYPAHLGYVRL